MLSTRVLYITLTLLMACSTTKPGQHDKKIAPAAAKHDEARAKASEEAHEPRAKRETTPPQPISTLLCPRDYGNPQVVAQIATTQLAEISGITRSQISPRVLWVHNDSGDGANLYAISNKGTFLGTLEIPDVTANDFEDITSGPCPESDTPCLWVGDVGDNFRRRDFLSLYVFPEPELSPDKPFGTRVATDVQTFRFRAPDLSLNSEAIMLDPETRRLYVFEKADSKKVRLFVHPGTYKEGVVQTLTAVTSFRPPGLPTEFGRLITAADLHPSGTRALVRVYSGTYEYRFSENQTPADLHAITPRLVAPNPETEPQGEAACYDALGGSFWTISENRGGRATIPLHHYKCKETPGGP